MSQQPFHIPCVSSGKTRLTFNVTVNLYVLRRTAPTFPAFSKENVLRRNPAFLGFAFLVFSHIGFNVTVNLHVMRPTAPAIPYVFSKKKSALQEGFFAVTALANFHSCPSQEEGQMLTKGGIVCQGDVGLFDCQLFTKRGSLL